MKECWNFRSLLIRVKYWCVKFIELVAAITVQKHKTRMFWKCTLSLELITFHHCWAVFHYVDVLLIKYKARYVCYVFCYLGHPVNRDYLLHASSIPLI